MRPGARFVCALGGGCCCDVHTLGPLSPRDVARVQERAPEAVRYDDEHRRHVLATTREGVCALLVHGKCSLHAAGGPRAKPRMCQRFPFEVIATTQGGRVATSHRCPCRTLGERPLVSTAAAEAALADANGRVRALFEAPARVSLSSRTSVSFLTYAAMEAPMLAKLLRGDPPREVLDLADALPRLKAASWRELGHAFMSLGSADASRAGHASKWFGIGLLSVIGEAPAEGHPRPWREAFDRAEAAAPPCRPEIVLGDYLADELWDLMWMRRGPFALARRTTGALASIASAVAARLVDEGARPDRAAAEAVMITDVGAAQDPWRSIAPTLEC